MEGQQRVGVVTLVTAGLQQELGQALNTALDALMAYLAKEACHRCQAVLHSSHTLTRSSLAHFRCWKTLPSPPLWL